MFQQSSTVRARPSSENSDVVVMVFRQMLEGLCLQHSRCLLSNIVVSLVQQRMTLCLLILHVVPSVTHSEVSGAQPYSVFLLNPT